ncbi:hypothetical protein Q4E93_06465 [Flavitalea sp. BT771]|uniref:hypothetical protein n=1 Tax=Flavitalea sp. BT771 TaxID=3063329 RepID=UPI0026E34089|nr:hypothetical protein [Flavitalea sp. BT771]MDO6430218.1 hypothetical protein [Flavitalea sp. BT771]MDV6219642.1 hypothetical protein [Flavitalea sp. BT771]
MKKINKIFGPIIGALLIIGVIYTFYKSNQLHHHYAFAVGIITEITPPGYKGYGDYSVLFEYKVNGKTCRDNNNFKYCPGQNMVQIKALLIGKQFPVAYGTKDASGGVMLLTQYHADQFKYTLPDSVRFYDSVIMCK